MGQLASAFPTAGGLYHWAAILGGRGWGWATAWFNLAGLITVLAAINVGTYRFAIGALGPPPGTLSPWNEYLVQAIGVVLITGSQAAINHLGIGVTARLTDFSGYWILLVAALLTVCLLAFAPALDPSRLVTFENFSGTAGGGTSGPQTDQLPASLRPGALLPAYTITGFDASAHAAEETHRRGGKRAAGHRPLGAGLGRGRLDLALRPWCWPPRALPEAAAQGEGAFLSIMDRCSPGRWPSR